MVATIPRTLDDLLEEIGKKGNLNLKQLHTYSHQCATPEQIGNKLSLDENMGKYFYCIFGCKGKENRYGSKGIIAKYDIDERGLYEYTIIVFTGEIIDDQNIQLTNWRIYKKVFDDKLNKEDISRLLRGFLSIVHNYQ